MANTPGKLSPRTFRKGDPVSAEQLTRIVNMLARRIVGGEGIRVRAFSKDQIVIELIPSTALRPEVILVSVREKVTDTDPHYMEGREMYYCDRIDADLQIISNTNLPVMQLFIDTAETIPAWL
jgi:hypothetical protein